METKRKFISPAKIQLEIEQGDITSEKVDAVVNAANSRLSHGGGVARAIAERGGKAIIEESQRWIEKYGPVTHSSPAYTSSGELPCKFVIHAVGPIWGEGEEERKLASAIRSSLELAEKLGAESIAFPAISTGIFGYPLGQAAGLFMTEFKSYLSTQQSGRVKSIRMILFDEKTLLEFLFAFENVFDQETEN